MIKSNKFIDTVHLVFDDFKDAEAVEQLLDINFDDIDELECVLSCSIVGGAKQTYWQPAELPECEDLEITYSINGEDFKLKDKLTDKAHDYFIDLAIENSTNNEQDAREAAAEARWESQRDEELQ